jgi:hypothetical protein
MAGLIFVYDVALKRGGAKHALLKAADYLGTECRTIGGAAVECEAYYAKNSALAAIAGHSGWVPDKRPRC